MRKCSSVLWEAGAVLVQPAENVEYLESRHTFLADNSYCLSLGFSSVQGAVSPCYREV